VDDYHPDHLHPTELLEDPAALHDQNEFLRIARENPVFFMEHVFGVTLWEDQKLVANAVRDNPLVSWRSGNGVGKSYFSAAEALTWSLGHYPSYTITTGASWKGVEKTLWGNIRRLWRRAEERGFRLSEKTPLKTELEFAEQWGIFGLSTNDPEAMAGFRSERGAFIICDEASDDSINEEMIDAMLGLCSAEGSCILLLGNPMKAEGPFYDSFSDPSWYNLHTSTLTNPNYVSGTNTIPGLASRDWVEMRRKSWGEDSNAWKSRVLGQFPTESDDVLIPIAWLQHTLRPEPLPRKGPLRLGCDVARYGADRTSFVIRDDHQVIYRDSFSKKSTMETCGQLQRLAVRYGIDNEYIFVDDGGVGGGVVDRLRELDFAVVAVNFGSKAQDTTQFRNRRAEMYWRVREALRPDSESPVYIPKVFGDVAKELTWSHYKYMSDGKLQMESKDDIRKIRKASPDYADAFVLTFARMGSGFSVSIM